MSGFTHGVWRDEETGLNINSNEANTCRIGQLCEYPNEAHGLPEEQSGGFWPQRSTVRM